MKLFRRRPPLPAASRPPLAPEERVLAWSPASSPSAPSSLSSPAASTPSSASSASPASSADLEDVVVATTHGIWLPSAVERLGWHEIHKAAWSGRELRITPAEVAEERDGYTVLVDGPPVTFLLLAPGELPDQVRTRVTRSVAYTTHHQLPSGAVRVVGRRVAGQNGLSWAVRYDAGTPVDSDEVVEATAELVGAARDATTPSD